MCILRAEWFFVLNNSSSSPDQVILAITGKCPLDVYSMGSKFLFPCCFLLLAQCKPYCPEVYFKDQEWSGYFSMVSTGKQILMEKLFDLSVCGFFFFSSYENCLAQSIQFINKEFIKHVL